MGVPRTVRLPAEQRRRQLLDTVRDLVAEEGFHAVSLEAVARRAGVSRPIVYGHFGDLDGLLEALVESESKQALEQLASVLELDLAKGDSSRQLLTALRGYLEVVRADPVTWRLVLMPPEGAPAVLRDRILAGRAAIVATLAQAVGPGLTPGRESPDPELTARALSALADESARLVLTDPGAYPVERVMAHAEWLLGELSGPSTGG